MGHLQFGGLLLILLLVSVTNPVILPFMVNPRLQMIIFLFCECLLYIHFC